MSDDVAELTRAMSRGEQAAVERFYRSYFDRMYRLAVGCTRRDESFCLDVVQDAVLRIIRSIQPMSSAEHLNNWLRVVIRTCALDRLRAEQRRIRREQARSRRDEASRATGLDGLEQVDLIARMLAALDPQLVKLIELRYAHGHTLATLARIYDSSTGAIDGRLRRAITALRKKFIGEEG